MPHRHNGFRHCVADFRRSILNQLRASLIHLFPKRWFIQTTMDGSFRNSRQSRSANDRMATSQRRNQLLILSLFSCQLLPLQGHHYVNRFVQFKPKSAVFAVDLQHSLDFSVITLWGCPLHIVTTDHNGLSQSLSGSTRQGLRQHSAILFSSKQLANLDSEFRESNPLHKFARKS